MKFLYSFDLKLDTVDFKVGADDFKHDADDHEAYKRLVKAELTEIKTELSRLEKHPELFPSEGIKKRFSSYVYRMCEWVLEAHHSLQEVADQLLQDFSIKRVKEYEAKSRPSFDRERKPWEQFLHKNAPGSGINLPRIEGEGCLQIVPMGALRIMSAMQEVNSSIMRELGLEAVSNSMRNSQGYCWLIWYSAKQRRDCPIPVLVFEDIVLTKCLRPSAENDRDTRLPKSQRPRP